MHLHLPKTLPGFVRADPAATVTRELLSVVSFVRHGRSLADMTKRILNWHGSMLLAMVRPHEMRAGQHRNRGDLDQLLGQGEVDHPDYGAGRTMVAEVVGVQTFDRLEVSGEIPPRIPSSGPRGSNASRTRSTLR